MRLYQLSKIPAFQIVVCIVVAIAVLLAFANIFNWITFPPQLGWISFILRALAGLALFGAWLLLNIPPPRLPNAKLIVVFAELGEEKGYDIGYDGKIKQARRTLLDRFVNKEDFDEDYKPVPSRALEYFKARAQELGLQKRTRSLAAMAGIREKQQLFLNPPEGFIVASGSSGLKIAIGSDSKALATLANNGHAADASNGTLSTIVDNAVRDIEPPPKFDGWKEVEGAREVTEYLIEDIHRKLGNAGLFKDKPGVRSDAAVYQVDFAGDVEVADIRYERTKDLIPPGREEDKSKLLMVIWGWNLHRSHRDFVPVFEIKEPIEEKYPMVNNFQLIGLQSFDLGVQNAHSATIFSSFVSGLCAYGSGKFDLATSEFSVALIAAHAYEQWVDKDIPGTGVDRSIIYFFLGNASCLNRQFEQAAKAYDNALKADPYFFHARHNLAITMFLMGREDLALRDLEKVEGKLTKRDPEIATTQYNLGLALLEDEDFENARAMLEKSIRNKPGQAKAYRAIGASYSREEQADLRNALKKGEDYQLNPAIFEASLTNLNKALTYDKNFAQVHVDLAELYFSRIKLEGIEPEKKLVEERGVRRVELVHRDQESRDRYLNYINRAKAELRKAWELDERLAEAHYYAGFIEFSEDKLDQAAESLRHAVELRPNYWEARELLVQVYRGRGQKELADRELQVLAQAGRIKLVSAKSYIDLGIGLLKSGQLDKARAEFEKALELESFNIEALFQLGNVYYEQEDWENAIKYYTQVQTSPDAPDEVFNFLSGTYRKLGDGNAALKVLNDAIYKRPRNAKLYYYLGRTNTFLDFDEDALQNYVRAIELDPNMPEAHFNLGQLYLKLRRILAQDPEKREKTKSYIRDANLQFRATADLNPEDADGWDWLGRTYYMLKELPEATKALEQAIHLNPGQVSARLTLANIFLEQADADKAIEQLTSVLNYSPNDVNCRILLGKAYAQANDLNRAIDTFQSVLTYSPDSADAHYNLGMIFMLQESHTEAESQFRAFLQQKASDGDGWFQFGLALTRQGKDAEALDAFKKVTNLSPSKKADAFYQMGQIYFRIRDHEKGALMFEEFRKHKGLK
jgi:tetratricopeptide (TPR) repeat protein